MAFLIDKNVLSKSLDEISPAFNEFQRVLNETPTLEEFDKAVSLAVGEEDAKKYNISNCLSNKYDNSMLYYPSAPATGDYITTTTTVPIPADQISGGYIVTLPSDFTVTSEIKTIDDIVEEKIEQYKELMRLQALGCKNCGGSISKDTMTCEYCGTSYVLAIKSKPEIDPRWNSF